MQKAKWFDLLIVFSLITILPAYYYGHHQGFSKGYSTGTKTQRSDDETLIDTIDSGVNGLIQQNTSLVDKYNQLSTTYNTLRTAVAEYVNDSQYQASSPVHCSTNYLGDYSYTNCN